MQRRAHLPAARPQHWKNSIEWRLLVRSIRFRLTQKTASFVVQHCLHWRFGNLVLSATSMETSRVSEPVPRYRIGAVAQLANLPVGTLRVWERRYGVVSPARSTSGHRFYSEADIHRVALLKNLVDRGHAIGSIAKLDAHQLERLAFMHIDRAPALPAREACANAQIVVVGTSMAKRIQKCLSTLAPAPLIVPTVFDNMTQAFATPPVSRADLLLLHLPSLHPDDVGRVLTLSASCHAARAAVIYAFAAEHTVEHLKQVGVHTMREPLSWPDTSRIILELLGTRVDDPSVEALNYGPPAPRRYADDVLTSMANASTTIACECPRHLADIIMQLSAFERYSNECVARTPADAFLHCYLANVSGRAREMFEVALGRLEREEGWIANRT
jgi:MerR family transcriptional regulator, light-induced transcriptional regulator